MFPVALSVTIKTGNDPKVHQQYNGDIHSEIFNIHSSTEMNELQLYTMIRMNLKSIKVGDSASTQEGAVVADQHSHPK